MKLMAANSDEEKAKKALHCPRFLNFPHFLFLGVDKEAEE